jgi:hypothetical protein
VESHLLLTLEQLEGPGMSTFGQGAYAKLCQVTMATVINTQHVKLARAMLS